MCATDNLPATLGGQRAPSDMSDGGPLSAGNGHERTHKSCTVLLQPSAQPVLHVRPARKQRLSMQRGKTIFGESFRRFGGVGTHQSTHCRAICESRVHRIAGHRCLPIRVFIIASLVGARADKATSAQPRSRVEQCVTSQKSSLRWAGFPPFRTCKHEKIIQ